MGLWPTWKTAGTGHADTHVHLLGLHHGCAGPYDQPSHTARDVCRPRTDTCKQQVSPHPGKEICMEFNEKPGQTAVDTGQGQACILTGGLFTHTQPH